MPRGHQRDVMQNPIFVDIKCFFLVELRAKMVSAREEIWKNVILLSVCRAHFRALMTNPRFFCFRFIIKHIIRVDIKAIKNTTPSIKKLYFLKSISVQQNST